MRQIVIPETGSADVLELREATLAPPAPGELRIAVKASGVNFADLLARQGLYPDAPDLPAVMGYEVSGVVSALGNGVDADWQGREVFALTRFGGYADEINVPVEQVFEKPGKLSFAEAAAIPVNYLTAWQLIVVMGGLRSGEKLLIHNAGGGVGLAAIDIGLHRGAELFGTASGRKHPVLAERGLHHAIDYHKRNWVSELDKLTGGEGVELILDPLGGEHWKRSYRALRATGRLGMFGISTAAEPRFGGKLRILKTAVQMPFFHPVNLMNANRGVFGVNLGQMWHESAKIRDWMQTLLAGVEDGWVRPRVDAIYRFEEAGAAHRYIEERRNIGKVILEP